MLLGTLSIAVLLRSVSASFLAGDKLYIKRAVLATTGGLAVLIVINKLLLATTLSTIAGLVGAGFLLSYIFETTDESQKASITAVKALQSLIFIGIFTLVASRLFGIEGLLVLVPPRWSPLNLEQRSWRGYSGPAGFFCNAL